MSTFAISELHVITERDDGPDLDDLVRLIRYLRHQKRVEHISIGSVHRPDARMTVAWWSMDRSPTARRGSTIGGLIEEGYDGVLPEAFYVDPTGAVCDEQGEVL